MGKQGSYNMGFDASNEDIKTVNGISNGVSSSPTNMMAINVSDKASTNNHDEINHDLEHGPERATWGHGLEFLMSCISLSVGLGNIWRFPFTCYENGGGAFLIPYIIVLILIGKPIYYYEMVLGQFVSKASVKATSVIPALKGIAIGQQLGVLCIVTYYTSLIALTLFYMIKSFSETLPWSFCWDKWTDVICIPADPKFQTNDGEKVVNGTSSSELYFIREVIKEKNDISDGLGFPDWQLTIYLLLAWIVIYLIIIKGVKSSGKVSYFLACFPYVVLIILLIRASTLNGTWDGIRYFITPDFKRLIEPQVWYAATTQLFFSLSVGQGTIIMFASFNRFDHNIHRDAMIVTTMDTFTSLLGGFTIFGILGNLAYSIGEEDIGNVIKSGGSGLAFISYPEAISKFKFVPQLFAVLFFFMLFTLGVGSAVGLQSAIVANLMDFFPKIKQWMMALICCLIGFVIGLLYVTPGGQWILNLVDHFGGTFLIFTLAIFQIVGIFWVYGIENFCWDVEFMLNRKVTKFWRFSWFIVTPVLLIIIFIYFLIKTENPTYGAREYPVTVLATGWIIFGVGMFQILLWISWSIIRDPNKCEAFKSLFRQNSEWGPKSPKVFKEWKTYKSERLEKRRAKSNGDSKIKKCLNILLDKYE
ncbi:hypothetical protein PVAND_000019 [Polypedilum vanderplanki]|uniref:Transporter n=1 Tax=Polypedilum vanderplanki TaxID=319348 RepID=A0A9J6BIS6_POLVA|nr:hypothetical protein PVAND_000019 [Polypedilum vanderplanki]